MLLYKQQNVFYILFAKMFYSYSDEGPTLKTSALYNTYDDDHKHFNLELSKLQLLW